MKEKPASSRSPHSRPPPTTNNVALRKWLAPASRMRTTPPLATVRRAPVIPSEWGGGGGSRAEARDLATAKQNSRAPLAALRDLPFEPRTLQSNQNHVSP